MTFFMRIRQYRVYRRLVISYVVLIVLSVSLVSTILYALFSASAIKEIDASSKQMLSQVSFTANVVHNQTQEVMSQLLLDNDVVAFLYEQSVNKIVNLKANVVISRVKSLYPFITNISLYNFMNGEYIDTLGLDRDPKIQAQAEDQKLLGFYLREAQKEENSPVLQLLTFRIVPQWDSRFTTPKSAIAIDVDDSYISSTIESINAKSQDANSFVMDASGTVLSQSQLGNFMENLSGERFVQQILAASENQGSFIHKLDGKKHLVTYVRSSTLDWFFITVRPYNELLSNIHALRMWTVTIAISLVVLGIIISLLLTTNLYNPLRLLLDRVLEKPERDGEKGRLLSNDEYELLSNVLMNRAESAHMLESMLDRSKQMLKSSSLLSLLKGIDKSTLSQIEQEWGDRLHGPYYTVIVFAVDNAQAFRTDYSAVDRELIRFAIGNISCELLGKPYKCDEVVTEDEIIVLLQAGTDMERDHLFMAVAEIQDTIRRFYGITVSAGIGDWSDELEGLTQSYRTAQDYLRYRLFLGANCIIDKEQSEQGRDDAAIYPSVLERKLINAVKLCSRKQLDAEIGEFLAYISVCSYSRALHYTNFLLLAVIKEFETMTELWGSDVQPLLSQLQQVQQAESIAEIRTILLDVTRHIVHLIEENKENVTRLKNERIMNECKKLIQEQYMNREMSLEYVAERVGLSAGYLGKLFKAYGQTSFNDYLTSIRMNETKRLLIETNETVAEIGARVGIAGPAYFSTVFKKHTGMSPLQFRENWMKTK